MVHSGMWAKTTIGVLAERPFRSAVDPGELIGAEGAEAAWLELQYVDQRDEVHAGVIETVIALVVGCLAEAVEVFGDGRVGGVVLARYGVHLGGTQAREHLLRQIKFGGLGQVSDVAGVDDERRLLGIPFTMSMVWVEGSVDVGIRFLIEADVRIADLHE